MYDVLRVYRRGDLTGGDVIDLNRNGRIHLHDVERFHPVPWSEVIAAQDAHEVVRRLEHERGWILHGTAPATRRAGLTYRTLARILLRTLDDRDAWTVEMEYLDASDLDEPEHFDASAFPSAERATSSLADDGRDRLEWARWWVVLRSGTAVLALHDSALLYDRAGGSVDLMEIYRHRHDIDDVTSAALAHAVLT